MRVVRPKKRMNLRVIQRQMGALAVEMPSLPVDECYKFVTHGHFSSIAFILAVAVREGIKDLYASTLRIGKKEYAAMAILHQQGKLDKAYFVIGGMQARFDADSGYDYFSTISDECKSMGWTIKTAKNHSKLILMETHKGNKYVLETSSNLNENPKIEQFSFERDDALYDFYRDFLMSLGEEGKDGNE